MVGGDVVVAWMDKQKGYAIDYFLDAKSQCSGNRGSCPDTRLQVNPHSRQLSPGSLSRPCNLRIHVFPFSLLQENSNSIRLLNAATVNGYSIVTYQRPLTASDELDQSIITNGSQAVIWAIGPLNDRNEVSFHSKYLKNDRFIEFGRSPPAWNCPMPDQDIYASEEKSSRQVLFNQE